MEYCEFLGHVTTSVRLSVQSLMMPFPIFNSKDPTTVLCWCNTQCWDCFQWLSAEWTDQHWALWSALNRSEWAIAEPLSSQLGWERGKLTLISADQNSALANQHWSEHVGESKDLFKTQKTPFRFSRFFFFFDFYVIYLLFFNGFLKSLWPLWFFGICKWPMTHECQINQNGTVLCPKFSLSNIWLILLI